MSQASLENNCTELSWEQYMLRTSFESTDDLHVHVCKHHDEDLFGKKRMSLTDHKRSPGKYLAICTAQRRINLEYAKKKKTGDLPENSPSRAPIICTARVYASNVDKSRPKSVDVKKCLPHTCTNDLEYVRGSRKSQWPPSTMPKQ